jgi:hypothetical protein
VGVCKQIHDVAAKDDVFIGGKQKDGPTGGRHRVKIKLHGETVPSILNRAVACRGFSDQLMFGERFDTAI